MCGLAGHWTGPGGPPVDARAMADGLLHRGPDDGGAWTDAAAGIALGHRRLAIIDLSPAGAQPMASPSGRYVTVYNGEIYNHAALRTALEADGPIAWRGHSDTETLVHAIERWGLAETLRRAVGMWALAVWDRQERRLQLARDRVGEKPLYWGWGAGGIVFGSELKALRAAPGLDNPVDPAALALFLRYGYVPTPHAILRGIYKLEPGVIATLSEAALSRPAAAPPTVGGPAQPGITLERYWSLADVAAAGADPTMDETAAINGLDAHLGEAVRLQSVADVPLGAFLSGGVDSSLIAALMRRASDDVHTFTIGFAEAGFDEAPHARAVARHLGTRHEELYVSPTDVMAVIPELPTIYDEPFADSSQLPTVLVSRLARSHVTVALSGDAGDELFGGYNRHIAAERLHRQRWLPAPLRRGVGRALTAVAPQHWDRLAALPGVPSISLAGVKAHKLGAMLQAGDDPRAHYRSATGEWTDGVPLLGHAAPTAPVDGHDAARADPAERMMEWDMASYLPDDILVKVDRAAMAASLETRTPFLDHRVIAHAWAMPLAHKIRGGQGKWAVRQLLYRYVPRDLIERPKAGFAIPLGDWLRGSLRDWAEALLARLDATEPLLDAAAIRAVWAEHLGGGRDRGAAIWSVLMFLAWHERWQAGRPATVRAAA